MVIAFLSVMGLCLGSFAEALTWRLREQSKGKKARGKERAAESRRLSMVHGRSMCAHCRHELAPKDLVPLLSWLVLGGKCRYCRRPIGWHAPVMELALAGLFVGSYLFWPGAAAPFATVFSGVQFALWLVMLTGFMVLTVYDIRWMLLPNKVVYPLFGLALVMTLYAVLAGEADLASAGFGVLVGGGLFLLLFQVSAGKWIGGGDVKLGALGGLVLADGYLAFLMLLGASILGTLFIVPGLLTGRVKPTSRIPFGPFLIIAILIVYLGGQSIVDWYRTSLLGV